jgi:hypothetical protein
MCACRKAKFSFHHPGDGTFLIEGFEKLNRLVFIPRYTYPPAYRIKNTYFAPKSDSKRASFPVYNSS